MPARNHVENPFEFMIERASMAGSDIRRAFTARPDRHAAAPPRIGRIDMADVRAALREGLHDLGVARTDVVFIALFYPIVGLLLARLVFSLNFLPLIFPLISGFAILGPLAAVGLYAVSRRLEAGEPVSWSTPFEVLRSPALSSMLGLGAVLGLIFLAWLGVAWGIYAVTLGPEQPDSIGAFVRDVFSTGAGWAMIVAGVAAGAIFAAVTFAISAVSFPLLLERDAGVTTAIQTSLRAVAENPGTMAAWGLIIAVALALGSLPALAGLIFVVPWLGHASWRLYRKLVD